MIGRPVTHLLPSAQAMAIRAKQPKVPFIRSPVSKAIIPDRRSALVPQFFGGVYMVNVENSVVAFSALDARAAKLCNESEFARPVSLAFVFGKAMLIPVIFAALLRTKAVLALFSAPFASLLSLPSCLKVAVSTAILTSPIFDAILVSFERLRAVSASHCDRSLFHFLSISERNANRNFDIACKRIEEAQRHGDMFIEAEKPRPPEYTGSLLDGEQAAQD